MTPRTILVDMDSIIADFYFEVINRHEAETGEKIPHDSIDAWDKSWSEKRSMFYYFSQPGFFTSLKPIPGAHDVLKKLHDEGHEIVIVSAATLTNAPGEKYEWLSKHYPWINRNRVFFAKEKYRVIGDFLIDDHHENVSKWCEHMGKYGVYGMGIGIEYPYNKNHSKSFDMLVPSYLDFKVAWEEIDWIIRDNL